MRAAFSVLSLLIVLAVVGVLVKKQMTRVAPAGPGTASPGAVPSGTPAPVQQQVRQTVEGAMAQPRSMPEEK